MFERAEAVWDGGPGDGGQFAGGVWGVVFVRGSVAVGVFSP